MWMWSRPPLSRKAPREVQKQNRSKGKPREIQCNSDFDETAAASVPKLQGGAGALLLGFVAHHLAGHADYEAPWGDALEFGH